VLSRYRAAKSALSAAKLKLLFQTKTILSNTARKFIGPDFFNLKSSEYREDASLI